MVNDVLGVILGGGRGTRLYPLTALRSKPAVPLAGKYRLIDVPISNCLNSGYNKIYVLTQFNSVSLHRHISQTYKFDGFGRGFVEILAAQQTLGGDTWYQGTADAVRHNLRYIRDFPCREVLILSGDQLYRMDLRLLVAAHRQARADATIAVTPVPRGRASDLGIMRLDTNGRVVEFHEKPSDPAVLDAIRAPRALLAQAGLRGGPREYLASMGIYCFNRDTLVQLLEDRQDVDFGKELFPAAIQTHRVHAYLFDGYWEDIGTIKSYHSASLRLAGPRPPFELYAPHAPIYSRARYLPPSRISRCHIEHSIVAEGCHIESATIVRSIIGVRCRVGRGTVIQDSVVMGADYFQGEQPPSSRPSRGTPRLGIGRDCRIQRAIIDKNACLGPGVQIVNKRRLVHDDQPTYCIRDGIVVVLKNAVLPAGTVI